MTKSQVLDLDSFFDITISDVEKMITSTISNKKITSILAAGKRLRPLVAQLSFKVCTGGKETPYQYQRSVEGTVAIELAHTASLVHDDIIDKDKTRRGKPAFHIKEGIPKALLIGHRMLSIGFNIALSHGKKFAKLYVDTWDEVLNGEMREVDYDEDYDDNAIKNDTDGITSKSKIFKEYFKIINMKTASLFSSACKAGAIEAEASGEILDILANYGREIGLAYQLADDLVDLENGEMIDSVIIPLLTRLENKTVDNNSLRVKSIRKKIAKNSSKIKQLYIDEIRRHVKKAENLSKSEMIPLSPYKDLLTKAPSYIANRMLKEINIKI
ncbi:MAG: polyprenyl synthetase family protein [Thermoplasmatales archaeon]|nr:polyprenyl synthetase family protein [Thermoplasmatales archaeon]